MVWGPATIIEETASPEDLASRELLVRVSQKSSAGGVLLASLVVSSIGDDKSYCH